MGHRKYVPDCPWRNIVAAAMAVVTFGAWVPFTQSEEREDQDDDEYGFVLSAPTVGLHDVVPPAAVAKVVDLRKPVPKPPPPPKVAPAVVPVIAPVIRKIIPAPVVAPTKYGILATFLRAQLGKPYVLGGNGPNVWDCSGLTKAAYAKIGINLPRTSQEQSLRGIRVSLARLEVGDLLFWGSPGLAYHVGIYVGGGHFIAAQNPRVGVMQFKLTYFYPAFARRIL